MVVLFGRLGPLCASVALVSVRGAAGDGGAGSGAGVDSPGAAPPPEMGGGGLPQDPLVAKNPEDMHRILSQIRDQYDAMDKAAGVPKGSGMVEGEDADEPMMSGEDPSAPGEPSMSEGAAAKPVAKELPPLQLKKLEYKAPGEYAQALLVETFQERKEGKEKEGKEKEGKEKEGKEKAADKTWAPPGWTRLTEDERYTNSSWVLDEVDGTQFPGDLGLKMSEGMQYYGLARELPYSWHPSKAKDGIFGSVEVKFGSQMNCGGAYFKLFNSQHASREANISHFSGDTAYSIMFGPDHCGPSNSGVHFILQRDAGLAGKPRVEFNVERVALPYDFRENVQQYAFAINRHTLEAAVYVNGVEFKRDLMTALFSGGLKSDAEIPDPSDVPPAGWTPPPREIPDPEAKKPADWDDSAPEFIPDTDAPVPEGWLVDEPIVVPNPDAQKPDGWLDSEDGEWLQPTMKNPKCAVGCGPWKPTKKNPDYKGPWAAPMIPNPNYTDTYPQRMIKNPNPFDFSLSPMDAVEPFDSVGFELWTVESGTVFNNLFITDSAADLHRWMDETYGPKKDVLAANREAKRARDEAMEQMHGADAAKPAAFSLNAVLALLKDPKALSKLAIYLVPLACGLLIVMRQFKRSRAMTSATEATAAKRGASEAAAAPAASAAAATTTTKRKSSSSRRDEPEGETSATKTAAAEEKASKDKDTEPTETAANTRTNKQTAAAAAATAAH